MILGEEQFLFANYQEQQICFMSSRHHRGHVTRYQQSPLVQGRVEALYIVIVEVLGPVNNNRTLGKYTEFVNILHKDPVESLF